MCQIPGQASRQARRTPRVLVVEDDVMARRVMCKFLKREGFIVEEAGDGRQALATYDQRQPDIVLLDIEMPVMDGHTTCRELRKRHGAQQLPIVMVSGNCDSNSVNRAYEEGANDFITKPVSLARLREIIEKWLHTSTDSA